MLLRVNTFSCISLITIILVRIKCVSIKITVPKNFTNDIVFKHFWKSTGLCPLGSSDDVNKYLNSWDERFNLLYVASLPNNAIKQVRIHWLLNLITVQSVSKDKYPTYNFTNLDTLLDWMQMHNLYPGFELMGNPSNFFNNLENSFQQKLWVDLVRRVASRYIERYGIHFVRKWRFETWNEPDLKVYNILNFTVAGYQSYVDACKKGLQGALADFDLHGSLKLGGPAGLFKLPDKHPLCWSLLKRCLGNLPASCPIQFLSFHKKGNGTAGGVLAGALDLLDYIQREFPASYRDIPVANDESDILVNWSKDETWRADVRYAAMVALVIVQYHREIVVNRNVKIEVLSNDNAFMNYHPFYFTQRTLLARFQMNNTTPRSVQFIKKPVYSVMALLSLLGNREMHFKSTIDLPGASPVTMLATNSTISGEIALLLIYANDTYENDTSTARIQLDMRDILKDKRGRYVVYVLDNIRTNPYRVWLKNGAPVFPQRTIRQEMRNVESPYRLIGPTNSTEPLKLFPTLPSVYLLHVCPWNTNPPGTVTKLKAFKVSADEILLVWKDSKIGTKCLKTYEIEFAPDVAVEGDDEDMEDGVGAVKTMQTFERVNSADVTLLSYQHFATGVGWYRIRAVDYWNRAGPFSRIIRYPV